MPRKKLKKHILPKRFNFLFYALLFLVFNTLVFPTKIAQFYIFPIAIVFVFSASYLLFLQSKRWQKTTLSIFYAILFLIVLTTSYVIPFEWLEGTFLASIINGLFLAYFIMTFIQLMREMFRDDEFEIDF